MGLPRDGAGEQRLAGAGRADQQRALWNLAAEAVELGRVLEEIDDLGQFLTRLVDACDIVEGDTPLLFIEQLRPRLAKAHRALAGSVLHLAHPERSEERRGGKEGSSTGRSRWW